MSVLRVDSGGLRVAMQRGRAAPKQLKSVRMKVSVAVASPVRHCLAGQTPYMDGGTSPRLPSGGYEEIYHVSTAER